MSYYKAMSHAFWRATTLVSLKSFWKKFFGWTKKPATKRADLSNDIPHIEPPITLKAVVEVAPPKDEAASSTEPQFVFKNLKGENTRKRRDKHEHDRTQAHYYLGDLLGSLDNYFEDFHFLKRGDPEGAANFEKFGCVISDSKQLISRNVEPFFYQTLPSQGCFYYGRNDQNNKDKKLSVRFVYFQKHRQPVNVQATNGTIYTIAGVYGIKTRHLFQVNIAVYPDRTVKVLKEISPRLYTVGKDSRKNDRNNRVHFARMEWGYPEFALDVCKDHNRINNKNLTVDQFFEIIFSHLVSSVMHAESDMNVRVKKHGRVATFSINMLRTPYFFADRQKTVNENGNTEKILHIVRPHERTLRGNLKKVIKAHWRGLRRFTWNDYDVSIGMPGAHYNPLTEFTAQLWDSEDLKREKKGPGISMPEVATLIDRAVTAQVRGTKDKRKGN